MGCARWRLEIDWQPGDTSQPKAPGDPVAPRFLANLKSDPSETANLSKQHPEIVNKMENAHAGVVAEL